MKITFSGDVRVVPVCEHIRIDWVQETLDLKVKAYGNGIGNVTYAWDKIDPCDGDLIGCKSCDDYDGCANGLHPGRGFSALYAI